MVASHWHTGLSSLHIGLQRDVLYSMHSKEASISKAILPIPIKLFLSFNVPFSQYTFSLVIGTVF